jgi:squalene cyclase
VAIQNADGGWGEDCDSYKLDYKGYEPAPSTASQTAWALLGLMAAGEVDHPAVARGIKYLAEATGAENGCGTRSITPAAAFRGCSICAITAIRSSSRSGRWRAIAT